MAGLGLVTLVVREHDEAIDFWVDRLGFRLVEDTDLGNGRAATPEQRAHVANQTGGSRTCTATDGT